MNILKTILTGLAAASFTVSGFALTSSSISADFGSGLSVIATDNGAGDLDAGVGVIHTNVTGGGWSTNVNVGTGYPVVGTLKNPMGHLGVLANGSGYLQIIFTQYGLGASNGSVLAEGSAAFLGGDVEVTYETYYDATNSGALATLLTSNGGALISGVGTYSNEGSIDAEYYSLSQVITIRSENTITGSSDNNVSVPDSGATALLLSLGLIGLGAASRRFKK